MNKFFLVSLCFLLFGCSHPIDEKTDNTSKGSQSDASPNVKAYIDPVTGELTTPTEKTNRVDSDPPPLVVRNEILGSDGSAILEPDFKPRNYLVAEKNCSNGLTISHAGQLRKFAARCDQSKDNGAKP